MKKICISILLALAATLSFAQPRTVGGRVGADGLSVTYQHSMPQMSIFNFMKAEEQHITVDFTLPYAFNGATGCATYDFTNPFNARIPEIAYGCFDWTLGAGIELGGAGKNNVSCVHVGVALHTEVEYNFPFKLQLAIGYRPVLGPSITTISMRPDSYWKHTDAAFNYASWYNFSLGVRYRF